MNEFTWMKNSYYCNTDIDYEIGVKLEAQIDCEISVNEFTGMKNSHYCSTNWLRNRRELVPNWPRNRAWPRGETWLLPLRQHTSEIPPFTPPWPRILVRAIWANNRACVYVYQVYVCVYVYQGYVCVCVSSVCVCMCIKGMCVYVCQGYNNNLWYITPMKGFNWSNHKSYITVYVCVCVSRVYVGMCVCMCIKVCVGMCVRVLHGRLGFLCVQYGQTRGCKGCVGMCV